MLDDVLQQLDLARGELNRLSSARHLHPPEVDHDVAEPVGIAASTF
jgi:hypothetical protein